MNDRLTVYGKFNFSQRWRFILLCLGYNTYSVNLQHGIVTRNITILSRVLVTEKAFGLVIGCINRLQLVTTNNYNTVPDLHNLQSLHYNLLRLFPLVFTIRFLATDLNTGIVTDSHFKYRCTKSLLITINTAMPLFLHFMVHCYTHTHTSPLLVMQLKHRN
jgi:hypothetical protein